jgi:hypothetical protein
MTLRVVPEGLAAARMGYLAGDAAAASSYQVSGG